MASVASTIRIDLMTNAASFNSGMTSAGRDGFGGFQQEAQKFDRWFNSRKSMAKRMEEDRDNWVKAMRGGGGPLQNTAGFLGSSPLNSPGDIGLRNQTRWKSMLPWGNSTTSTLSPAEADQAANFGSGMSEEGRGGGGGGFRGGRRFIGSLLRREGMGPFGPLLGGMMENISGATVGIAAFGAGILAAHTAAASLGNEIKQTREEAIKLGMTYDQYVAQKGLPEHSRFVEGGALAATAGYEGAKGIGAGAWGLAVKIASGGTADISAMADVARSEEQGKLLEQKMKAAIERHQQAEEGVDHLRSKVEALDASEERAARNEWIKKFSPTAEQIEQWDKLSAAIHRAKAGEKAGEMAQTGFDQWREAKYGAGFGEEQKYRKEGEAAGMSREDIEGDLRLFRERRAEAESFNRANAAAKSLATETPEQRRDQALADAQLWHSYHNTRLEDERTYQALRRKANEDYYKEAEGFDARQMQRQLRSNDEVFEDRIAKLTKWGGETGHQDLAAKQIAKEGEDRRKQLGVGNPLGDFAKDVEERRKAIGVGPGKISQAEYDQWLKGRRKSAVGEMVGDIPSIRLNGAMAAGSAEAHSLIAQASTSDPRTKAAIDAVNVLNRIAALLDAGKSLDQEMLRAMKQAVL